MQDHASSRSAHLFRLPQKWSRTSSANIASGSSSDSYPLLHANNASFSTTPSQYENAAASDIELVSLNKVPNFETTTHHQKSIWSTYNPFSSYSHHLSSRQIRASRSTTVSSEDAEHISQGWRSKAGRVIGTGWRAGTRMCCFAVVFCIVIELTLLIWASTRRGHNDTYGLIYEGSCDTVRTLEVWLLLPLNIAATILISTSNYVMQVMSAPNREDVDQAHCFAKAIPLGGVNFDDSRFHGKTGRSRRAVWWLLFLSSLPIHLFLNVAFYGSVQAINPGVVIVSEDFVDDPTWSHCATNLTQNSVSGNFTCWMKQLFDQDQLKTLPPQQCKSQYELGFQKNASSVIVVTEANPSPWYGIPLTARVPSSYGIACQSVNYTYDVLPDSERLYGFTYVERTGSLNIGLPFDFCQNNTDSSGSGGTLSWSLSEVSNSLYNNLSLSDSGALLHGENDSLSEISSILSVFTGREFRYFATAQATGDYLSRASQALLSEWDPSSWLCQASYFTKDDQCDAALASDWKITPQEYSVKECYAMPKEQKCALRYSLNIIILTMCCDLIKLVAMILALRSVSNPLTTLGDIIQSFLQRPDLYTKSTFPLTDDEASRWSSYSHEKILAASSSDSDVHDEWGSLYRQCEPTTFELQAREWIQSGGPWWMSVEPLSVRNSWSPKTERWVVVPSRARWGWLGALSICAMLFLGFYFAIGLSSLLKQKTTKMWTVGFSGPDPNAIFVGGLLSNTESITWAAIVVNLPQLLFSSMYFVFNSTLTIMHTAHEWGSFSQKRKTLRVSSPRGQQRSTHWLQLPWTYSLPLIVGSGSLHWLLGRSVYLVKVDVFTYNNSHDSDKDFFACGYSLITVLLLIIILIVMIGALVAASRQQLEPGIPLVRVNSLAIAAACHPDPAEEDLSLKPLMWGVINTDASTGARHCSFSAKGVTALYVGDTSM